MAHRIFFTLLALSLLAGTGCSNARRGPGFRDTGVADTGTPPGDAGTDSNIIVLPDTGMGPTCSPDVPCPVGQTCVSGVCRDDMPPPPPECSGAADCAFGERCISGRCVPDGPRICEGSDVMYNTGAFCSASTMSCVSRCADNTCVFDCLDADSNPDCRSCVNGNSISCTNRAGCQPEWDVYVCCIEDACGVSPTQSCLDSAFTGACSFDVESWQICSMGVDTTICPAVLEDCF